VIVEIKYFHATEIGSSTLEDSHRSTNRIRLHHGT
jgi:hypothetical protein